MIKENTPKGLSLQNISVGYGKKVIVKNVSFKIPPGRFCALLGLNGSGKTTLLKAIMGILPLKSGTCAVNGINCHNLSEYQRARFISYIPQRHSKLIGVRVLDVVMMGFYSTLGILEFPSNKNTEAALFVLEKMDLKKLAYEDFSRLSEGQKQMVILSRTLIQNTPVMLMDEPDSALDFLNRHWMLTEVRDLIHKEEKVGIMTLHDPGLALGYCDYIILIQEGEIVAELDLFAAGGKDKIEKINKINKINEIEKIKKFLSQIYGDITLLEHKGRYIVLP